MVRLNKGQTLHHRFARILLLLTLALGACRAPMHEARPSLLVRGQLGEARTNLYKHRATERGNRAYLLDRMRAASLTLADGYPASADALFREVYDVLRTQGINADRTVQSVVLYEGVRIWKGEPFEQALALTYVAMTQAGLGSWDNARAAADNALFYLRDFSDEGDEASDLDPDEIARRALVYERARDEGLPEEEAKQRAEGDYFDTQYVPRESNYTLGYLLAGVANRALDRDEEAAGQFQRVVELAPGLEPLVEAFHGGDYNTVLVVGYGLGPAKRAYGPDGVFARFDPRTRSTGDELSVRVAGYDARRYPLVTDVNAMARSHLWNNTEQLRRAKSILGQLATAGGLAATAYGIENDNPKLAAIGAGVAAVGLLARAGSRADTRYADTFPQRFYAVPLRLPDQPAPVTLRVDRHPASRLVLHGLAAPGEGEPLTLRYVRLPGGDPAYNRALPWAISETIQHTNPHQLADAPSWRPYVYGGDDARPPSATALAEYHKHGHLTGVSLTMLRNAYRGEGLTWSIEDHRGFAPRHMLEGGRSLVSPVPGTLGYTRLFAQGHPPYEPRTKDVKRFYEAPPDEP